MQAEVPARSCRHFCLLFQNISHLIFQSTQARHCDYIIIHWNQSEINKKRNMDITFTI